MIALIAPAQKLDSADGEILLAWHISPPKQNGQMYTFISIAFSNTSTGRNCMMSRQKLAIHQLSTTVFFDDFLKMFGSLLKLVKYQIESCRNDGVVEKKAGKGYS